MSDEKTGVFLPARNRQKNEAILEDEKFPQNIWLVKKYNVLLQPQIYKGKIVLPELMKVKEGDVIEREIGLKKFRKKIKISCCGEQNVIYICSPKQTRD